MTKKNKQRVQDIYEMRSKAHEMLLQADVELDALLKELLPINVKANKKGTARGKKR
jgi:hypothetical protein